MPMDVQEAVRLAKDYVLRIYAEEIITNVGLEEIKLDDRSDVWRITIGFSRPWDNQAGFTTVTIPLRGGAHGERTRGFHLPLAATWSALACWRKRASLAVVDLMMGLDA